MTSICKSKEDGAKINVLKTLFKTQHLYWMLTVVIFQGSLILTLINGQKVSETQFAHTGAAWAGYPSVPTRTTALSVYFVFVFFVSMFSLVSYVVISMFHFPQASFSAVSSSSTSDASSRASCSSVS